MHAEDVSLYEQCFQHLPFSVILYQLDGIVIDANAMTEHVFNISREGLIGTYNVLKNPENINLGVPDYFAKACHGEIARLPPVFFSNQSIDGKLKDDAIWVQTTFVPIRSAAGSVVNIAAIEVDVTRQVIAEQARDELSTPLIPISHTTVVMPLIGAIDDQRASRILETLLEGVAQHNAQLAILDITGVLTVDTQVAQVLIQAAQAVSLLGARIMLTGIQPQIAQTLVHLGVDLSNIITRSDLQAGIADAQAGV